MNRSIRSWKKKPKKANTPLEFYLDHLSQWMKEQE